MSEKISLSLSAVALLKCSKRDTAITNGYKSNLEAYLTAGTLQLSKPCESEVLVKLIALGVKGLPHRHDGEEWALT